jgi:flavodoxin
MSSILIVYYSRSGTTRRIAQQLAEELDADLLAIEDPRPRSGILGFMRSAIEAMRGAPATIEPVDVNLSGRELVLLGTPVWSGHVSSPMRRFLIDHGNEIENTGFFCTMGRHGADETFRDMREIMGKQAVAKCAITQEEIENGTAKQALDKFVTRLREARPEREVYREAPGYASPLRG